MATDSNLHQSAGGVRTYRGRTLEEILPQVRAELGPDAVILREREGLVGGVGGFFAQRFIEVEARRGDGQSIDIYDDTPESDMRALPQVHDPEEAVAEPKATLPPEPTDLGVHPTALPPEPVQASQPRPFVPPAVKLERSVPQARRFETTVFMDRLREASAVLPDEEPTAAPALRAPEPEPAADEPPAPIRRQRTADTKPKAKPATRPRAAAPGKPRPRRQPASAWSAEIGAMPTAGRPAPVARELIPAVPAKPEPVQPAVDSKPRLPVPELPAPELHVPQLPVTPNPYQSVRRRPTSIAPERPGPVTPLTATANGGTTALPVSGTRPTTRERQDDRLRKALGRLIDSFRQTGPSRPAPAKPLDLVAATEVANQLSTRGASQAWTSQLISAAGAHGNPLSGGSLRAATAAEVARRIIPAPALPVGGAVIAFIGAGGSGKTRCTAALASAYRHGSTLAVTVLALDNPDGARELRRLLREDDVPVLSLHGEKAERAVQEARDGGLVIVDTGAATPTDPGAVRALGAKLKPLGLDAVYVTLPATLGPQAARRVLASFGTLKPSAVAITHADETDQLAVVVEIAVAHRIPLAYFHSGTDHRNALSIVDPPAVAEQLLP